jgi:uncharacterized membrane protein YeaQ/YmgE (transglycosylase-associated protein family)
MSPIGIIVWLVTGAIGGWIAGRIMKGGGFGLAGNVAIGVVGAVIAGAILPRLGLYLGGVIGQIINAFIGACLLLFVVNLAKR